MNEERKRALEAFDRLRKFLVNEDACVSMDRIIRLAAIATDYPEKALRAGLIAETEAKG